jgi:hypothetical protein
LTVGHEFLLAGISKNKIQVTRINNSLQTNKVEWTGDASELYGHLIFELDSTSGRLTLALYGQSPFDLKAFPSAVNFVPLKVGTPKYVTKDTITLALTELGLLYTLRYINNQFVIDTSQEGSLKGTTFVNLGAFLNVKKILSSDKELYFVGDGEVCIKPFSGDMSHLKFKETVYDIVLSPARSRKRLFVSLDKGAVIIWPDLGNQRVHVAKMLETPEICVLRNGIICMINRDSGKGWLYRTKGGCDVICLDRIQVEPDFLQLQQGRSPDELALLYSENISIYQVSG